jgi:hypothetical protein
LEDNNLRRSHSIAAACLLALMVLVPAVAGAQAVLAPNAHLTSLGTVGGVQRYRYDYKLVNQVDDYGLTLFRVFFNSVATDPFAPSGDYATYVSHTAPTGWNDVYVLEKNAFGQWYIEWNYEYNPPPDPLALGDSLEGFSVVFDWTGPDLLPSFQHVQASNGQAYSGQTNLALGSVAGVVMSSCGCKHLPLQGVTMDLFFVDNGEDVLVASVGTDASGSYSFGSLPLGEYRVAMVTPLGYYVDPSTQTVTLTGDQLAGTLNFTAECIQVCARPRNSCYWKGEVNSHKGGRCGEREKHHHGRCEHDESFEQMLGYVDLIVEHFNQNIVNPVIIYDPAAAGSPIQKIRELLTVNRGETMLDNAKQEMLALLLNVVSGKIAQTQVISSNGATVSQAITYCNDLITDGINSNDCVARNIADIINNGHRVPSGMVPSSTRVITYRDQVGPAVALQFALAAPSPNPVRGTNVNLSFTVGRSGAVNLAICDVAGRKVRVLASGQREPGNYHLTWDGRDDSGRPVTSGVYYIKLAAAEGVRSGSFVMMR